VLIEKSESAWRLDEWYRMMMFDCESRRIGKLDDIYIDVETAELRFALVRGGFVNHHYTFVRSTTFELDQTASMLRSRTKKSSRSRKSFPKGKAIASRRRGPLLYFGKTYEPVSFANGCRLIRR